MKETILILSLFCFLILSCKEVLTDKTEPSDSPAAYTLEGIALFSNAASLSVSEQLLEKKQAYLADSSDIMNLIWYGRFIAYSGDYDQAIDFYSKGIERFPAEERLYRHRGHRYITVRKFDEAIHDFSTAAELIKGKQNAMEPDGMPNAMNIPVSTTHGNIYYHLGLSYYLKQDFPNAFDAYLKCLNTGSSPDNIVSATHWIYSILNRMGKKEEANNYLKDPRISMGVIENMAYKNLCLFYKGEISETELIGGESDLSANDAVLYGVANFHFYNGNVEKAVNMWNEMQQAPSWNSFGYIAAESELFALKKASN